MILTIPNQLYGPLMPKNILIDLNIILDVFLKRKGYEASVKVLEIHENSGYKLFISAHCIDTLAYVLESAKVPRKQILAHIDWLVRVFEVVAIDSPLILRALGSNITDFEDALVEQAAQAASASAIITRNLKDFKASKVSATDPETFLETM
jgi:predicted nucleic-acid-binding protein